VLEAWRATRYIGACEGLLRGHSWSRKQLVAFQRRRLRALVRHAYERVPYYRRLMEQAAVRPEDIRSLADLSRIPLTSRADVQALPVDQIVARGFDPRKLVEHRTSGSTGEPLSVRQTRLEGLVSRLYQLRLLFGLGLRLTDRGANVVLYRSEYKRRWYRSLGLLPNEAIHCLLPAEEILSELRRIKPDILGGYPGSLCWLAGQLTQEDRSRIRPRFIPVGAEMLTSEMRRQISEGFGAPVYDFYSSHELSSIAWECTRTGRYHICEPLVIGEILRDGRPVAPGETGEFVGTVLDSYAMPFIRYRQGDLVTRGETPCPCGAPYATIIEIQGRLADRFNLPDGRSLHPYALVGPLVLEAPWVRRYQIIQERLDRIAIKLVPVGEPPADAAAAATRRMAAELGGNVQVEVQLVKEIPPDANGKFRPYYSLLRSASTPPLCPPRSSG